jgi:ADP-heptose:LPS heptosyltransferase
MRRARWAGVARLGGLGDNLVAASVCRPLKRLGYNVEVITSAYYHMVFLNNPFIDKLSVKKDGEIPEGAEWQKWFKGRAGEYDKFVNFSHSMEVRHALQVNSTPFWWPQDYRRKLCAGSYLETVHDIMGVPYEFGPLFYPTEEETDRAAQTRKEQIGGKYVAWVIAGSRIDKVYPYAAMAIARIIKELGISVVMVGHGGKQFEYAKQMTEHVQRQNSDIKKLHLALAPGDSDPGGHQHWGVRRSLTQTLLADLVITPDTGMAWAVAMEPMPKIVTLSHASVENITKHWFNTTTLTADPDRVPCWPCHRLHDDISTCTPNKDMGQAAACISDIPVETLLSECKRLLEGRNGVERSGT